VRDPGSAAPDSLVSTGDEKCTEATAVKSGACCDSKEATLVSTGAAQPMDSMKSLVGKWKMSGGEQKKIGRRLAVLDLQGGENVRRKPIVKASAAEGDPHALRRSAGGDANRLASKVFTTSSSNFGFVTRSSKSKLRRP